MNEDIQEAIDFDERQESRSSDEHFQQKFLQCSHDADSNHKCGSIDYHVDCDRVESSSDDHEMQDKYLCQEIDCNESESHHHHIKYDAETGIKHVHMHKTSQKKSVNLDEENREVLYSKLMVHKHQLHPQKSGKTFGICEKLGSYSCCCHKQIEITELS